MDTDTTFQHLNLPLEWLFNRWGFVQDHTSIAMPVDTMEVKNGDKDASKDSRGQVVLNAGFIVVQRGEHTMAMLDAWKSCTDGKRYKDCGHWKKNWSHEQRVFSEYIRYDFNSDNTIVSIPCDDAMGYPGIIDKDWVISNCTGQFIRHHTLDKWRTKSSATNAIMQAVVQVLQQELHRNWDEYWMQQ